MAIVDLVIPQKLAKYKAALIVPLKPLMDIDLFINDISVTFF